MPLPVDFLQELLGLGRAVKPAPGMATLAQNIDPAMHEALPETQLSNSLGGMSPSGPSLNFLDEIGAGKGGYATGMEDIINAINTGSYPNQKADISDSVNKAAMEQWVAKGQGKPMNKALKDARDIMPAVGTRADPKGMEQTDLRRVLGALIVGGIDPHALEKALMDSIQGMGADQSGVKVAKAGLKNENARKGNKWDNSLGPGAESPADILKGTGDPKALDGPSRLDFLSEMLGAK